jgi:AraC-like DNA-binding protein
MHKQPRFLYKAVYFPKDLPEDFPLLEEPGLFKPSDEPISTVHFHNCMEIGYCVSGEGSICIENKILPYMGGDISVIFNNVIHIHQSSTQNESCWKFIYVNHEKLLSDINIEDYKSISFSFAENKSFMAIISHKEHPELTRLVFEIAIEFENCDTNYKTVVKSLLLALLGRLSRTASSDTSQEKLFLDKGLLLVEPALKYISTNYATKISISYLAVLCNTSITNFRRVFKAATCISPHEYLILIRVKMASVYLKTTESPISKIALDVGFSELSSFNRYFKSIMGISPTQWRKSKKVNK